MKLLLENWRRFVTEDSQSPRSAFEILELMASLTMDKMDEWIAATLPEKGTLTSEEQREAQQRFNQEAFDEISPPEFNTREELISAARREMEEEESRIDRELSK